MTGPAAGVPAEDRRARLRAALRHADLTLDQLWLRYFELGGNADLFDLEAHLDGLGCLPDLDGDLLAVVVNERLDELFAARRVPYSRPLRPPRPTTGPLAALLRLLDATRTAPPDRLAPLAAEAGRALGVDVSVHVVDHEQRELVRLPDGRAGTDPVAVDGTLPGRVFQSGQPLPSEAGGVPRLWVPLLDGADRMGVLEVRVATARDLEDPGLREQCRWLAAMVAHLVTAMGLHGDLLERTRRSRPRSPSAELVWQQLPPLTAASDTFVLAGSLEPSAAVGGDAFDYALTEHTVSMTVLDAVGHGLGAGLMAAAALAASRAARREGRGLHDQARAVDEVVATTFSGSAFVTGVLAELDLTSGLLRYVRAGHPPPLLLRSGRVVKELAGSGRVPLGLTVEGFSVAEEALEPGDWLALYTDGVTEARDGLGRWFGEQRLIEFLTRAVAAGQPPPETVRRLMHAVLDHQGGVLQDDASILLACWSAGEAGTTGPGTMDR